MKNLISVPVTFAGFPSHNEFKTLDADFAIIGIPYEPPYLKKQSYSSKNAAATIRQESLWILWRWCPKMMSPILHHFLQLGRF